MTIEESLKGYAKEIGITAIGITSAEPFLEARQRLKKMQKTGYLSPWVEPDLEKRTDPYLLMADAQSLIAVGLVYPPLRAGNEGVRWKGKLARFAQYQDYHAVLRRKMEELVGWLRQRYPALRAEIYVDTGPLIDREVAYRAALGFIGKNAALIHPEYGSFLALGEILTNIVLQADEPLVQDCGACRLCLDACPQGAIKAPGEIDTRQCLAHYTQEKGILPPQVQEQLGMRLWGCDTCQEVCPYNRGTNNTEEEYLWVEHGLCGQPDLTQVIDLTNREYQKLVGNSAMAWRGKTTLQRNALINLGNLRDPETIPVLQQALTDPRPVIRATAAVALSRVNSAEVQSLLHAAWKQESDEEVCKILEDILGALTSRE